MPIKALYCRDEELRAAIAAMRELAHIKIGQATAVDDAVENRDGVSLKLLAYKNAKELLSEADRLERSVNGMHEQPTADEEKEELRKILDGLFNGVGYRVHGSLSEQVQSGVNAVQRQRDEAFGLVGTLVDDQRIRLEALKWMVKSALTAATHSRKNAKLYLAEESIDEILNELQKIDKDNPSRYSVYDWHHGSFNLRKLNAEIYQKDQQIRNLKERLEVQGNDDSRGDQRTATNGRDRERERA